MTPVPACTIVSNNYLALARVLAESYREHHPGARVFVCLVDRPHPDVRYDELPFETLTAESLDIEGFASLAFGYGILELNTAVKPFLLEALRARHGLERVFYLDPDILVLDRLAGLEQALERGPMVLTPHITAPLDDERQPSERLVLLSGVYNLGFVGLRLDDSTAPFLRWWRSRLRRFCLHDVEHGLFVDQSWMDLAPALLPDVQIARDAVFNVAYWNLAHRRPRCDDGRWRIDGRPLGFFHFSGLPFDDLDRVSRYQDRIHLSRRPELRPLFEHYRERVMAAGHAQLGAVPYAFGRFEDGRPVPELARRVLRRVDPEGARWPDPFACGRDSFAAWLTEPLAFAGGRLNRLALSLWEERPDLQGCFPDVCGADLAAFVAHLVDEGGASRAGLPPAFLDAASHARAPGAGLRSPAPASVLEPFDPAHPGALLDWLNEPLGPPGARPVITRFALHVHARRADARHVYPEPLGRDRRAYAYWFAVIGADETGAHPDLVAPVRRSLPLRSRLSAWLRRLRRARAERRARENTPPVEVARPPEEAVSVVAASAAPFGVNLVGRFEDDGDLGRAARGAREALRAAGVALVELSLECDPRLDVARGRLHPPHGLPHALTLLYVGVDETPQVLARLPLAARAGGRVVGCWFWELAHFPLALADRFELVDEVWAPSRFAERALLALARAPVRHVPPVLPEPRPAATARAAPERERFVFCGGFDGRAAERFHPEALIAAFARAHARSPRPLALLLGARHAGGAHTARLREQARGLPVTIAAQDAAGDATGALMAAGDAYVSLHRADALGCAALEALARGLPVIATAYGGPCDWLDEGTGYPVGFRLAALERDQPPWPRGAVWAEADVEQAAEAMCRVARRPEEAAERTRAGRERVRALYGRESAAPRLVEELWRLAAAGAQGRE
jgi:glycosyltransferase involved in cell wall biosynthesis